MINQTQRGQVVLAVTIAAASAVFFFSGATLQESYKYKSDFAGNYLAWYAVKHNLPFYETAYGQPTCQSASLSKLASELGLSNKVPILAYSPAFAVIGCILPDIPYHTAEKAMVWVTAFIWLLCAGCLIGAFFSKNLLAGSGLFVLATFFPPAIFTIAIGQVNIAVFALILLMAWALSKKHDALAGIPLAVAMLSKTHLGLCLLYFALKKRWTALFSAIATLLIFVVASIALLGLKPWLVYIKNVLPFVSGGMPYIDNQSICGMLSRIFTNDPFLLFLDQFTQMHGTLLVLSSVVSLLMILVTLWYVRKSEGDVLLELSAVILAALLAPRIVFLPHFVWAFLPIVCLSSAILEKERMPTKTQMVLIIAGTALLFLPWQSFFYIFLDRPGWPRLLACNTAAGSLLLWFATLSLINPNRTKVASARTQPRQKNR